MVLSYQRKSGIYVMSFSLLCLLLTLLTACGGANKTNTVHTHLRPTPTATPKLVVADNGQGQQILQDMAHRLNTASSLHGLFNLTIDGQALSGTMNSEIWNVAPDKSRVEVRQSTLSQETTGSITVTDGTTLWEYDPTKNVVYTGPAPANTQGSGLAASGSGQSRFLLTIIQTIFNQSAGTLQASGVSVDGHTTDDVHIVPASGSDSGSALGSFNYTGEVYIDQSSHLPIKVILNIDGIGTMTLELPMLELNQPLPGSTFTFTPPANAQVLSLQQAVATPDDGTLTLVQAQRQSGFHLLSIPVDQSDYTLEGVTALGISGSQIFSLNYIKGNVSFSVAQGKALANLPGGAGPSIQVHGVTGTFSSTNGTTVLSWTQHGVGIRILGTMSHDQFVTIANLLA